MGRIILIETTLSKKRDAQRLASMLLAEHHIACATISNVESHYTWQGKRVEQREWLLSCKTSPSHARAAQRALERAHPYDVPMILSKSIDANAAYADWVSRRPKTKHIK